MSTCQDHYAVGALSGIVKVVMRRIGFYVLVAASFAAIGIAEARQVKYIYLKVGEGEGASVYAFKSKPACEVARRKHDADWARMIRQLKKNIGNRGTFAAALRTRCLDTLPLGFERPRVGG
jgi:hypothetical protein